MTIFAAKMNPMTILLVGSLAMSFMHVISCSLGAIFPMLFSSSVLSIICVILFLGYGFYMIFSALKSDDSGDVRLIHVKFISEFRRRRDKKTDWWSWKSTKKFWKPPIWSSKTKKNMLAKSFLLLFGWSCLLYIDAYWPRMGWQITICSYRANSKVRPSWSYRWRMHGPYFVHSYCSRCR